MFNWFKRKSAEKKAEKPAEKTAPKTEETVNKSGTEGGETAKSAGEAQPSPEDYLKWAKAAYKNIQERQEEETQEEETKPQEVKEQETQEPEDSSTVISEEVKEDSSSKISVEETQEEVKAEVSPEVTEEVTEEVKTEVSSEITEEVTEEKASVTPSAIETPPTVWESETIAPEKEASPVEKASPVEEEGIPAWMKKSDALEKLKESAIEQQEEEKPERGENVAFDEDFMWSAKVLAAQGRTPEDISIEEIAWLKQLREGLGKTRRSLVNQLKAVVGQGPLNDEAVMEIEGLLLKADIGVDATGIHYRNPTE